MMNLFASVTGQNLVPKSTNKMEKARQHQQRGGSRAQEPDRRGNEIDTGSDNADAGDAEQPPEIGVARCEVILEYSCAAGEQQQPLDKQQQRQWQRQRKSDGNVPGLAFERRGALKRLDAHRRRLGV